MAILSYFSKNLCDVLETSVSQNMEHYLSGNIKNIIETNHPEKNIRELPHISIDFDQFDTLLTDAVVKSDEFNALIIWKAFENLTPKLAADERIWIALTHQYASKFVIDRYVSKKDDSKYNLIRDRFFCRLRGPSRGIQTRNALSRLWWGAYSCEKASVLEFSERLHILMGFNSDFTQQFFERPTTSHIPNVIDAILCLVNDDLQKEEKNRRVKRDIWNEWFKKIDKLGGKKLLSVYDKNDLIPVFDEFLKQCIKASEAKEGAL